MIFVPSEECFGTLCEDYVVHFQIKFGKMHAQNEVS